MAIAGGDWTAKRVILQLVEEFTRLPGTPIYCPTQDAHELVDGPWDLLIFQTAHYLGRDSPGRLELLTYTRAAAAGHVGLLCQAQHRSRTTLYRHAILAAAQVAGRLNARQKCVAYGT